LLIIQNLKLIRIKTHYPKVGLPSYDDKFTNIFQIIKEKSNQTMTEKNFQIQQIKIRCLLIMLIGGKPLKLSSLLR
jgi:hypothetical protein